MYARRNSTLHASCATPPKRISSSSGTVVMPLLRNFGRKNRAMRTMATTATTSHIITASPVVKPCPLRPTSCSVERLVNRSENAMKGNVSDRPARKKPLSESAPTPPRDFHQVMPATSAVKKTNDANVRNMQVSFSGGVENSLAAFPL